MPTILLVPAVVAFLWACGAGLVLLLLRKPEGPLRPVLAPFVGLAAIILSFYALLATGLNGGMLGRIIAPALLLLSAVLVGRRRFARAELREAAVPLATGLAAVAVVCWPLLAAGWEHYIGTGNPDAAFFSGFLRMFEAYPIEMARTPKNDYWRGLDPGAFTGMFGVAYAASAVTGISPGALFATVCAAATAFLPWGAFLLCATGLQTSRRTAIAAAVVVSFSSLAALAFQLQSLGTLLVMGMTPAALGLAMAALRSGSVRLAAACSVPLAVVWYAYPQGAPFMIFVVAGVFVADLVRHRRVRAETVRLAATAAACVALAWVPYTISALKTVVSYSTAADDREEMQLLGAPVITERGLPFVLGIANAMRPLPTWLGGDDRGVPLMAALAVVMIAAALVLAVRRHGGVAPPFLAAVAGGAVFLLIWWVRVTPYGVFKSAQWLHPLLLTLLVLAAAQAGSRVRRALAGALLLMCLLLNIADAQRGAWESLPSVPGSMDSASTFTLADFRHLETIPPGGPVSLASADRILMYWMRAFLGPPSHPMRRAFNRLSEYHSWHADYGMLTDDIGFNVSDSTPVDMRHACDDGRGLDAAGDPVVDCRMLRARAYLRLAARPDVAVLRGDTAWRGGPFELVSNARDTLLVGRGWYLVEAVPGATGWQRGPFRWLRRRGEVLVIQPSAEPHVLRIAAAAGYGNPSPDRNLVLFANGEQVDRLHLTGYGVVYSRPLTLPGPVSQLELFVEEEAQPLASQRGWLNAWVPRDVRRLNLAVSSLEWLPVGRAVAGPESLMFERPGLWEQAETNGVFADAWMSRRAAVTLACSPGRELLLRGMLPGGSELPLRIDWSANGVAQRAIRLETAGEFTRMLRVDGVDPAHRSLRIDLHTSTARRLSAQDPRELSIRLLEFGCTAAVAPR